MPVAQLDATFDERHALDPARPHHRESLVWVLALPEEGLGAFAYTWVDAHGRAGAAGMAFGPRLSEPVFELVDGLPVPDSMRFTAWEAGPLRSAHTEALRRAEVSYEGSRVGLQLEFEAMHPPYAFASHAEGFPSWFADDRYEQGGRAKGTLTLDGETFTLDTWCHRDHSWGARDWGAVTHYKWLNFLADGVSVHVMDLHGLGQRTIRGYVHRDGETAEVRHAAFDYGFDDAFHHTSLSVRLEDSSGRTTVAQMAGPATAQVQYPINPRLTLVDVTGPVAIDGTPGAGYLEMAWTPGYLSDRQMKDAMKWDPLGTSARVPDGPGGQRGR